MLGPATAPLLFKMNIHNLFPLPVAFFNRPVTDEEVVFVKCLETRSNTGNTTSTNNFVLKSMTPLRSWIEDCVSDYFKATTAPKHNVNLKITQSWVNFSDPGQYHHKHAHPNSFVSGVYYLQTNPDDRITFTKTNISRSNSQQTTGMRTTVSLGGLKLKLENSFCFLRHLHTWFLRCREISQESVFRLIRFRLVWSEKKWT